MNCKLIDIDYNNNKKKANNINSSTCIKEKHRKLTWMLFLINQNNERTENEGNGS